MSQRPDPYAPPHAQAPYGPPREQPGQATALDAILPTNPLAAAACWIGIVAGGLGTLLGLAMLVSVLLRK